MFIGSVDAPERLKKHQMRKEQNTIRSAKKASAASASNCYSVENYGETEIEYVMQVERKEDQEGNKDEPYTTFASKYFQQPTLTVQIRLKLDKTALAITSSVIQDLGLILESDTSLATDKNKISNI
ncbi:hypothetical protein AVEN_27978-1 [Araneus ventricosus]|uniref:Uncharacterized protein n=1 Tax=Araneus ventricosus TaxID=182803 RepID=A0A4Y2BI80_ARAVE|nr:hypothetical protein AVEN_27978-1 [Araneus ventricosus]